MAQRIIPEATGLVNAMTPTAYTTAMVKDAIQAQADMLSDVDDQAASLASKFSLEGARSLGSVFGYATSKWALSCLIMAVILNRTHIFASTRRNLTLPWKVRFLVRIAPIFLLLVQARWLLQSIQCQTSPDFPILRWGNASKSSDVMFIQNGGLLHTISSSLLLYPTDADSCLAANMIPRNRDQQVGTSSTLDKAPLDLTGSLSLLWPLFKTLSLSQFVETVSCAVQGRQVAAETGMTLFEHSLAFAEADAAVGSQLGWGPFGGAKVGRTLSNTTSTVEATHIAITRGMILGRLNTTPEVLFVGFLSTMNHFTSHVLGIFNLQSRLRLINTGAWGLAFMSVLVWSIVTFSVDDDSYQSLLRFPTVCIIGFIPHVLILFGIIACSIIYGAALTLSALAPPGGEPTEEVEPYSFTKRLLTAHQNMQANIPLSGIRITMQMDFYTALLRTGFTVMTVSFL